MSDVQKTAVVTGGARGIGRAICLALAAKGINIVTCYSKNSAAAEEVIAECEKLGVKGLCVKADVSVAEDVTALIEAAKAEFGRVDILVNNAGITRDNLIMGISEEDFDSVIATNLKGAFLATKAVSRLMIKQRGGRIINISSVVGVSGNAGQANYSASKAGLLGLTKSVAKELGGRGVTVNAIAPGFIETDMTDALSDDVKSAMLSGIPMKRLGKPEDVANLVAFLASDEAAYITGQVICVDGGMAV